MIRRTGGKSHDAVGGHGERTSSVGPIQFRAGQPVGYLLQMTVQAKAADAGYSLIRIAYVETSAIRSPVRIIDRTVQPVADGTRVAAIAIHNVQPDILVSEEMVIVAEVRDFPAVGRKPRGPVRTDAMSQRSHHGIRN